MSVLFIATSDIVDQGLVDQYLAGAPASLAGREVQVRAFTTSAQTIEGNPPGDRVVVLEFPDEAAFRSWYDSPEYQAVLPHRLGGTSGFAQLVDALPTA